MQCVKELHEQRHARVVTLHVCPIPRCCHHRHRVSLHIVTEFPHALCIRFHGFQLRWQSRHVPQGVKRQDGGERVPQRLVDLVRCLTGTNIHTISCQSAGICHIPNDIGKRVLYPLGLRVLYPIRLPAASDNRPDAFSGNALAASITLSHPACALAAALLAPDTRPYLSYLSIYTNRASLVFGCAFSHSGRPTHRPHHMLLVLLQLLNYRTQFLLLLFHCI
ncbi:hypothetical protein TRVL_10196 [Trypanosoma vivax]|nr:hypothetical protein TRVL_10196 [Trypanosoma vivax]